MKGKMREKIKENPIITWLLLVIQTVVFIFWLLLVIKFKEQGYHQQADILAGVVLGAESHELFFGMHQYWRVITATFMHFGFMHFLMNTIFLYSIGSMTELVLGHGRYLLLYIMSALFGNFLPIVLQSNTLVAGASGALFGLMGMWTIIWLKYRKHPNFVLDEYGKQMFALAVANIVLNFFMDGVSILGHLGGFLGGMIYGLLMIACFKPKILKKAE